MFVKICGITNRDDALAAVDAGARALGFIFYPPSPRHITPEQLAPWVNEVPAHIWKVGVFVNESPASIERIAAVAKLDIAQLHGAETPDDHPRVDRIGKALRIWKAFRAAEPQAEIPNYPAAEAILIDGIAYDWTRTAHITRPLILAGGLDPDNIRERIERATQTTKLLGVDVASGIESSPGRKDHARMKKFIRLVLNSEAAIRS